MIHYTCDCCKQPIDLERGDQRYIVRVEVYAAVEHLDAELDDDRDHLEEIQEILERLDADDDAPLSDDVYQQNRFDLCSECRARYVKNPLGRSIAQTLGFSPN